MATANLPLPGLLAEFVVLGLQAVDFGAQLSHLRAQVLHRGGQSLDVTHQVSEISSPAGTRNRRMGIMSDQDSV